MRSAPAGNGAIPDTTAAACASAVLPLNDPDENTTRLPGSRTTLYRATAKKPGLSARKVRDPLPTGIRLGGARSRPHTLACIGAAHPVARSENHSSLDHQLVRSPC